MCNEHKTSVQRTQKKCATNTKQVCNEHKRNSLYPTKTIKELTCMSYEEEDTCMSYEEEDTCMSYDSLYPTKTIKEFGKMRLLLHGDILETSVNE